MTNPTRLRRRFTAQQKAEAVELCLQEGISCMPWPSGSVFPPAAWPGGPTGPH